MTTMPLDDERTERSRRYPAVSLRDALLLLESVHRGLGLAGGSRESLAQALGHGSLNGASKRKIAALAQYGLMDRDGERHRISDIGRRILIPISDGERVEAITEAVRRPALFQEIGNSYDQQPLPSMLANVLAREHGVLPQVSTDVAAIFVQSVEHAGLLSNGILNWSGASTSAAASAPLGSERPATDTTIAPGSLTLNAEQSHSLGQAQDYSVPLDSRGRKALVSLPMPVLQRDLDRLVAWIGYMRTVVVSEAEESAST